MVAMYKVETNNKGKKMKGTILKGKLVINGKGYLLKDMTKTEKGEVKVHFSGEKNLIVNLDKTIKFFDGEIELNLEALEIHHAVKNYIMKNL